MSNLKIFRELVAKTMCLVLLLAGVSLPAGQAYAQSGTALEEITVVARRIAENLQDVPVSVTVMARTTLTISVCLRLIRHWR